MEEDFVPYPEALALKKLGFNEPCLMVFYGTNRPDKEDKLYLPSAFGKIRNSDLITDETIGIWWEGQVTAPLYRKAFKWFRDKYNLNGQVAFCEYAIKTENSWKFTLDNPTDRQYWNGKFDSHEEAELACLKNLIELAKEKNGI